MDVIMDFKGKNVLVVGTGISGIGATNLLNKMGAFVILYDGNENLQIENIRQKITKNEMVTVVLKEIADEIVDRIELVVVSPGVPLRNPVVEQFIKREVPIWGEIELAYQLEQGTVIGITGTNGKTTTTALTGKIIEDYCKQAFVVGNIGTPYTKVVLDTRKDTVTVAEISSFQLETVMEFHPKISAILNITPDHLDRHLTMENYVKAKENITKKQGKDDLCILNYEDEYGLKFAHRCESKVVFFSSKRKLENGYYLREDTIVKAVDGKEEVLLAIHDMALLGIHNVENVMAAIAMTDGYGVPMAQILKTVKAFQGVEHRIEFVANRKGVNYYNDSKGTNPDAAIKGIQAMNRKTVIIGGGYDKDSVYDEWIESFGDKVSHLVLLGETKDKIAICAMEHGFSKITMVDSLEEAVAVAETIAKRGEAVLLSPACASWDMFPNYEVRGEIFKELVKSIKE